jgi:hypothetical protein
MGRKTGWSADGRATLPKRLMSLCDAGFMPAAACNVKKFLLQRKKLHCFRQKASSDAKWRARPQFRRHLGSIANYADGMFIY